MTNKRVFIIAEAGVNHNGDINIAYKLCDAAKEAGVDAVKFQTWQTNKIITKTAELAKYQEQNIKEKTSQYEMLKKLELSFDDFRKIKVYCDRIGISFLTTSDVSSLDFVFNELNVPVVKIGSGDVTNIPYLRKVGQLKKEVILSTGMSTMAQVEIAYNTLVEYGAAKVIVLHCTTNYPCPKNEVNLNAMLTIKEALKCEVGYSDHTMGLEVPIAAVAMGATMIEKHFTLDKTMDGPDHKASIEPTEMKKLVSCIRNVESAMGDGIKRPNRSEHEISRVVLKRILAAGEIRKGTIITEDMIVAKRSDNGISASYWDLIVGTEARRNYNEDEPIVL